MSRSLGAPRAARAVVLSALICCLVPTPLGAAKVIPEGAPSPVLVDVSGRTYSYYGLTPGRPLESVIEGPAIFEPILRWRFIEETGPVDVQLAVVLDGETLWHRVLRSTPGGASYPEHPDWTPGRPSRLSVELPFGSHSVVLRLEAPLEGTLDVNPVVSKPEVLPWRAEWRFAFGAAYDSNIFRYSDSDVDDFLDGRRDERFPVEYVDDLRLEPSVDLEFVRERPGRSITGLRLSADWRLATVNGRKSFSKLAAQVREKRMGVGQMALEYAAIPSYHVREFWDGDATGDDSYRSCDFRKHSLEVELGSDAPWPVDLKAFWRYDYYGYDPDFVEYDSDAVTAGAGATVRPLRGLRLDAGYGFRSLSARGYDELGEVRETSDESDISYEEDQYTLSARWDAERATGLPVVLTLGGALKKRYYQSEKSAADDPFHAGREDTFVSVTLRGSHSLSERMTLEAFYEYRRRESESGSVPDIGDLKDYAASRVGLRLIVQGERILD